jgi:hypothetical protein
MAFVPRSGTFCLRKPSWFNFMPRKLIIIVEVLPFLGENAQRVKREFISDLNPVPRTRLKLLSGPPRIIGLRELDGETSIPNTTKLFEGFIHDGNISYFPEENITTVLFLDTLCLDSKGKKKISAIIAEYQKHGWEIVQ